MNKLRFWSWFILAIVLGFTGFILAATFPLPDPFTLNKTRLVYSALGILLSVLIFARVSTWVVKTTTRLLKLLITRIAFETINQFTQLSSKGLALLPQSRQEGLLTPEETRAVNLGKAIILDTSTIIDGRILDIAKTGFLTGLVLVPNFVLTELQQVADSADSIKRARGRKGFEIVSELKKIRGIKVDVWDKDVSGKAVDDKLIRLGKMLNGKVFTCDFNLNRVAKLSGVDVLNLNELANSLKTVSIPGEKLRVKIIQTGKDKDQGVGYLTDGTMVVVKDAASSIGNEIETEVTKILQGPAGRMVFGKTL